MRYFTQNSPRGIRKIKMDNGGELALGFSICLFCLAVLFITFAIGVTQGRTSIQEKYSICIQNGIDQPKCVALIGLDVK